MDSIVSHLQDDAALVALGVCYLAFQLVRWALGEREKRRDREEREARQKKSEAALREYQRTGTPPEQLPAFRDDTGSHELRILLEQGRAVADDRWRQELLSLGRENAELTRRIVEAREQESELFEKVVRMLEREQEAHDRIVDAQKEMALALRETVRSLEHLEQRLNVPEGRPTIAVG